MKWVFHSAQESFGRYQKVWDELNQAHTNHLLLDSRFIDPLIRYFGSPDTLLGISKSFSYPGMVLVERNRKNFWRTFQPAQAPLGPILLGNSDNLETQMNRLMCSLPGYALGFGVTQQDPEKTYFHGLTENSKIEYVPYIKTARLTLNGTFDEYWRARGRDLSGNLRKRSNRLEKSGVEVEMRVMRDVKDVADCLVQYGKLEGMGWKGREGTAVTIENVQGAFYQDMLERFCENGEGVVYTLLFNGETVAGDLCVERDGIHISLKIAYDESVKQHSPSFMLRKRIYESLYKEGNIKIVEFYGRFREWHAKWTDESRRMFHVNFYRSSLVPLARNLVKRFTQA